MPAPTTTTTTTTTTIAPGPWISTPLVAGPLAGNSYCMTISGLAPSTCYEYQSVFVVSGTTYYACNTCCGVTQAIATSIPTVKTGTAPHLSLTDGYYTCGHCVIIPDGNLPIQEYGILYTANPSYNSDATLTFANVGPNVFKDSTCGSISIGVPYTGMTTGLPSNTNTYYRAFAKNALGVGNGLICSEATAAPAYINVDVMINWDCFGESGSNDGMGGVYRLFCCDGTLVESCTISLYSKSSAVNWSAFEGCYYVDFSGVQAYINYAAIAYNFMWWDNTHIGESSICTCCFSGDNIIGAELPSPAY